MSSKNADSLTLKGIPDVASPVIVATKEKAARDGEGNGGDTTEDVVVSVGHELSVRTNIEQTAGGIIRARGESITVREESETASTNILVYPSTQTHWTAFMSDSWPTKV